jgi:hypothetical protein
MANTSHYEDYAEHDALLHLKNKYIKVIKDNHIKFFI